MVGQLRVISPPPSCGPSARLADMTRYLRQRNQSERALGENAMAFHIGPEPLRIRRMLERPLGSVRWKNNVFDRAASEL